MKKMMLLLVILSGFAVTAVRAQTFAEWFNQKKTQIKYYTQQISLLQTHFNSLKQGYKITGQGNDSIGSHTGGEFGLHTNHINSLSTVNPAISGSQQVKEILSRQSEILTGFNQLESVSGLSGDEQHYVTSVRTAVLKECDNDLSDLQQTITSGQRQMTDNERIARVQQIYNATINKYQFTCAFSANVHALITGRAQGKKDIGLTKSMYGIH